MLSLVDACLGRLPVPAAPYRAPLLQLLGPFRPRSIQIAPNRIHVVAASAAGGDLAQKRHAHAAPAAAEDFFAGGAVTFGTLGLSPEVSGALQHAGFQRPAHAQVRRRQRGGSHPGA